MDDDKLLYIRESRLMELEEKATEEVFLLETHNRSLAVASSASKAIEWKEALEETECPPVSIFRFEINDPPAILEQ